MLSVIIAARGWGSGDFVISRVTRAIGPLAISQWAGVAAVLAGVLLVSV